MSAKATELIDFAIANGIAIHSRTNPEEWATTIAENGGQCPCKHAPACPCDRALEKIKDTSLPPEEQMCGCAFFVSNEYLEHYGHKPWTPGTVTPKASAPATKTKKVEKGKYIKVREVDPEVEKIALKKANVYMNGLEQIKEGKLRDFQYAMENEIEDSKSCSLCLEDAEVIGTHVAYAETLCRYGRPECGTELENLINHTIDVIDENFMTAGFEREELESQAKPGKTNAWMNFAKGIMSDPILDGKAQKYKMKIAAKLYHHEFNTIEEAMAGVPE